jgi:hypothetical protein
MNWRTHIDPVGLNFFGVTEAHVAFFWPHTDRGGPRQSLVVMVPVTLRSVIRQAMRSATQVEARVAFVADARPEADAIADRAARMLPKHRRISYELAAAGQLGQLQ